MARPTQSVPPERDPTSSKPSISYPADATDAEKGAAAATAKDTAIVSTDDAASTSGYSEGGDLQVLRKEGDHVKTAQDGVTVLIPQPSDDPADPLNWSPAKKNRVLASVILASVVCQSPASSRVIMC